MCGLVGALVSVNDFSIRPARVLTRDDRLDYGPIPIFDSFLRRTCLMAGTPAFSLKNPNARYSARIFFTNGVIRNRQPRTASWNDAKSALLESEAGPFANYVPYTHHTGRVLETLAEHEPKTLATMHGSTYYGDGARALRDLATVMRDVLGPKAQEGETTSIGTIKA